MKAAARSWASWGAVLCERLVADCSAPSRVRTTRPCTSAQQISVSAGDAGGAGSVCPSAMVNRPGESGDLLI